MFDRAMGTSGATVGGIIGAPMPPLAGAADGAGPIGAPAPLLALELLELLAL